MEENKIVGCGSLNYEAEWDRMRHKHNELTEKHAALEADFRSLQAVCDRMSAQLEIVHLIFGGRG